MTFISHRHATPTKLWTQRRRWKKKTPIKLGKEIFNAIIDMPEENCVRTKSASTISSFSGWTKRHHLFVFVIYTSRLTVTTSSDWLCPKRRETTKKNCMQFQCDQPTSCNNVVSMPISVWSIKKKFHENKHDIILVSTEFWKIISPLSALWPTDEIIQVFKLCTNFAIDGERLSVQVRFGHSIAWIF